MNHCDTASFPSFFFFFKYESELGKSQFISIKSSMRICKVSGSGSLCSDEELKGFTG